MNRVLYVVGLVTFATSLFTRAVDPIIPQIAAGLWVDAATAALLTTAFALPYAILQPALGPIADVFGKARVMTLCLLLLTIAAFASAVATSFPMLLGLRVVSGIVSGGIFPAAMAFAADLAPLGKRQVALSRVLFAGMSGNLLGAAIGGVVADLIGWRGVFVVIGSVGVLAFIAAVIGFRGAAVSQAPRVSIKSVPANYRAILANPRAKVCFGAVFLEGVFIMGLFPYVAQLLLASGEPRASIAGLVIGGFWIGGVLYTVSVGNALELIGERAVMFGGACCAAVAMVANAFGGWWPYELAAFVVLGLGFYSLHGSIQVYMTELAPEARGSAASLHSSSFFLGQAIGPIVYGFGIAQVGATATLLIAAVMILLVGAMAVRLLHDRGHA
jgi:predicted MFS family arabinose efflux permease